MAAKVSRRCFQRVALADVADADAPERTLDVAEVGRVEDGRGRRLELAARVLVGA